MSTSPIKTAGTAAPSLKDRLDHLQRQLARQRRRTQAATVLTVLVGLLILAALCGYFVYGYMKINEVAKPETVLDWAELEVNQRLPEGRQMLEKQIIESSPDWAKTLSQQVQDNIPKARESLEKHVMEQYASSMQEVTRLSDDQFRKYLKDNRKMLEKRMKELEDKPELAEAPLEELTMSLDEHLQSDMKAEAKQLLQTLIAASAKLKLLKENKNLTPELQTDRLIVMQWRRLQKDYVPTEVIDSLSAAPGTSETPPADPKPVPPAGAGKGKGPMPKKAPLPPGKGPTKKITPPESVQKDKPAKK
jgi:hypothetical protein